MSSVSRRPSFQSEKGLSSLRPRRRFASAVRLMVMLTRGVCRAIPRFFAIALAEVTTPLAMRPSPRSFSPAKTKMVSPLAMCFPPYIVFCQPRIHTDEHRNPRRDEGTAGEVRPAHVPWQPDRHQRNGLFEIGEMGYAEGNQGQAVEHPRDAQTLVAGGETEALPVLVTGEPGVQNPGARHHHRGVTAGPPCNQRGGSEEDVCHPKQQQP